MSATHRNCDDRPANRSEGLLPLWDGARWLNRGPATPLSTPKHRGQRTAPTFLARYEEAAALVGADGVVSRS
jgi:hypothetical protein